MRKYTLHIYRLNRPANYVICELWTAVPKRITSNLYNLYTQYKRTDGELLNTFSVLALFPLIIILWIIGMMRLGAWQSSCGCDSSFVSQVFT